MISGQLVAEEGCVRRQCIEYLRTKGLKRSLGKKLKNLLLAPGFFLTDGLSLKRKQGYNFIDLCLTLFLA